MILVKHGKISNPVAHYFSATTVLMTFKSRYPKLKLVMIEAGTQSIQKMLLDGDIDLGIIQA
jgi:DNA-binding transcriptional LysR family regulator